MKRTSPRITQRLVAHFGDRERAAEAFGVSLETIRLWLLHGVPLEHLFRIEAKTAGAITAEEIVADTRRAA